MWATGPPFGSFKREPHDNLEKFGQGNNFQEASGALIDKFASSTRKQHFLALREMASNECPIISGKTCPRHVFYVFLPSVIVNRTVVVAPRSRRCEVESCSILQPGMLNVTTQASQQKVDCTSASVGILSNIGKPCVCVCVCASTPVRRVEYHRHES